MTKRRPIVEKRSLSRKGLDPEKLLLLGAEDDARATEERCRLFERLSGAADAVLCRYGQRELSAWWENRTRFDNPSAGQGGGGARARAEALFEGVG